MCTLYNNLVNLCKAKGVSGSRMCLDLGLSKSTMTDLKNGRIKGVSINTAQKMAAYFNITVDELYGIEKEKAPDAEAPEAEYQEVIDLLNQLPEDKRQNALDYLKFLASNNQ